MGSTTGETGAPVADRGRVMVRTRVSERLATRDGRSVRNENEVFRLAGAYRLDARADASLLDGDAGRLQGDPAGGGHGRELMSGHLESARGDECVRPELSLRGVRERVRSVVATRKKSPGMFFPKVSSSPDTKRRAFRRRANLRRYVRRDIVYYVDYIRNSDCIKERANNDDYSYRAIARFVSFTRVPPRPRPSPSRKASTRRTRPRRSTA